MLRVHRDFTFSFAGSTANSKEVVAKNGALIRGGKTHGQMILSCAGRNKAPLLLLEVLKIVNLVKPSFCVEEGSHHITFFSLHYA